MVADEKRAVEEFARHLGIHFNDPELLKLALTHRSFLHLQRGTSRQSNERLEFLGDSVLGLITSEHLYKTHPNEHEGQLTKTKSLLVSKAILSRRGLAMGLGRFVLMSNSEVDSGGRQRLSILADAFEAVLGAIYLDQGIEAARKFVETWLLAEAKGITSDKRHTNYKSLLQEYVQSAFHTHPVYRIRHEHGPDHSKLFTVEVMVGGKNLGSGRGKNKKEAEQSAARDALDRVAQKAGERRGERREEPAGDEVRAERPERAERAERPERGERRERGERPERGERGERRPREERREREPREAREGREPRELREGREPRELREGREPREAREGRELREGREPREGREGREGREPRAERVARPERADRPERGERMDRPDRPERMDRPERAERPDSTERGDRAERGERGERPERGERGERGGRPDRGPREGRPGRPDRGPRPAREDVAFAGASEVSETTSSSPRESDFESPVETSPVRETYGREAAEPREIAPSREAAAYETSAPRRTETPAAARASGPPPDLSSLNWTTSAPERSGMSYGRQPAVKGRSVVQGLPDRDPTRTPIASESPAAAPKSESGADAPPPSVPREEVPRVDVEVKELKGPPPGVDAARYRTAESPIARFASETPSAWEDDPKEHE